MSRLQPTTSATKMAARPRSNGPSLVSSLHQKTNRVLDSGPAKPWAAATWLAGEQVSGKNGVASLPPDAELGPEWDVCIASIRRPASQTRIKALMERGFHQRGDVENRLGYYVGQLGS
jgi:hypothetical protein